MNSIRRLLIPGLASLGATLSAFAVQKAAPTYTVVGYFRDLQPKPELVQKAALAVSEKMAGMAQVQDANEADHAVEILFQRDGFKIYVDALPLERKPAPVIQAHSLQEFALANDRAMERDRDGSRK